ncbi:MAG: hypothetical protein K1X95_09050 [Acidimicrobiia bacterium]|nr:hypothetical protein [Acidimicrobiia bacterium]
MAQIGPTAHSLPADELAVPRGRGAAILWCRPVDLTPDEPARPRGT